MKKYGGHAAVLLNQKFTEQVYRVAATHSNDIAHPFADERLVLLAFHRNQQHSMPVADGEVVVVPAGQTVENIVADSRAKCGVSQAFEHLLIAAVVSPRRD